MNRNRSLSGFLAILFLVSVSAAGLAADPNQLVPEDVAVYIEISDGPKAIDRLLAPDVTGRLEAIPDFKKFLESNEFAQLRGVVSYIETRLGTEWRKAIADLTGGGAVFAIRPGKPDFVLLILRAKDPELLRRTNELLIELAESDAKEKGKESPVKSVEYKGVKAWTIGKQEFHAIVGDTVVFSNKQEGLKTVLEMNAREGPRPIAELSMWKEARSRVPARRVAWAFGRLDVLRQANVAKDFYEQRPRNGAVPILFGGLSHVLGGANYGVASLVMDQDRLAFRVEVPRDGQLWPEEFRGFYAETVGQEAAVPIRPARTIASLSFYRDLKTMWDTREQLVAAEVLPRFTELENNVGQVLFGGREFASEVLGQFEPRFRLVAAAQDYSQAKLVPDIKIPAFALIAELKNPEEFGPDLRISFQSVLGLVNLGLGQQNQPRLMLAREAYNGFDIDGARFLERPTAQEVGRGVHLRHNFSPACTIAGRYFVIGSTTEIVRDVIDALGECNAAPRTTAQNVLIELDVARGTDLLAQNQESLVSQNMVENGNTREQAEREIGAFLELIKLFGQAQLTWTSESNSLHVDLAIDFAKK